MATTLATPSNSLAKMRWEEPYVSDGLNAKLNGIVPAGVVRGGRLVTGGAAFNLTVMADLESGDSVYSYINAQGRQITFRQVGDVTLDLTALANTTVFIGLEISYVISSATAVAWKSYSQAEIDADPTIIVLGRVVVPAAGPIPAADVTALRRRSAWESLSPETREWRQFAKNGSFDVALVGALPTLGSDNDTLPGWDTFTGVLYTNVTWSIVQTGPRNGLNELRLALSGAAAQNGSLYQAGHARVRAGKLIRASVWVRSNLVAPGPGVNGHLGIGIGWYDGNYGFVSQEYIDDISIVGTTAYTEIVGVVEAPAGAEYAEFFIFYDDDGASSSGDYFFDDFRVWVERDWSTDDDVGENESFTSGEKTYALDIVEAPPIVSLANLVNRMFRMRSDGFIGSAHEILASCRDATTPFLLKMLHGAIRVDRDIQDLGGDWVGLAADAARSRVDMPIAPHGTSRYTLFAEFRGPANGAVRVYVSQEVGFYFEEFVVTINAKWDGTQWTRDVAGNSSKWVFSRIGVLQYAYGALGASPWADVAWALTNALTGDAVSSYSTFTDMVLDTVSTTSISNPAYNANINPNALYAKNIVKAWGYLRTDGAGGFTVLDGFGWNTITIDVSGRLDFLFDEAMDNANYAVVGSLKPIFLPVNGQYTFGFDSYNHAVGGFSAYVADRTTGAAMDLNVVPIGVSLVVCGQQTS